MLFASFWNLGPPFFSHFGHLGALFTVHASGHQKRAQNKSCGNVFLVLLEDPFSRLFSIFCGLFGSLRGMNSGTGARSVFPLILDDFGELLGGFLDHFSGRTAKTKKHPASRKMHCRATFSSLFFGLLCRRPFSLDFGVLGTLGAPQVTILKAGGDF